MSRHVCNAAHAGYVGYSHVYIVSRKDKRFAKTFPLLQPQQQQQILVQIEIDSETSNIEKWQFSFLKALIVFGYFTSELGVTKALNYQPVPGGFIGSIPANADTKSWSPQAYY